MDGGAQLASDVVQPAHRARVLSGAGAVDGAVARAGRGVQASCRSAPTRASATAAQPELRRELQADRRQSREGLSARVGSGEAAGGVPRAATRIRVPAACSPRPAICSCRARSTARLAIYRADDGTKLWEMDTQTVGDRRTDDLRDRRRAVHRGQRRLGRLAGARPRPPQSPPRALRPGAAAGVQAGRNGRDAAADAAAAAVPPPPPLRAPARTRSARGATLFGETCSRCHGENAMRRPEGPALHDAARRTREFNAIVLDGIRKDKGMVGFRDLLTQARCRCHQCLSRRARQRGLPGLHRPLNGSVPGSHRRELPWDRGGLRRGARTAALRVAAVSVRRAATS